MFLLSLFNLLLSIPLFIYCSINDIGHFKKRIKEDKMKNRIIIFSIIILILPILIGKRFIYTDIIFKPSYYDAEVLCVSCLISIVLAVVYGLIIRNNEHRLRQRKIAVIMAVSIFVVISSIEIIHTAYEKNKEIYISEVCRKEIIEVIENNKEKVSEISYITIYNPNEYDCVYSELYLSTDEDYFKERKVRNIIVPKKSTYTIDYDYGSIDISKTNSTKLFLYSEKYNEPLDKIVVPILLDDTAYSLNYDDKSWSITNLYPPKFDEIIEVNKPLFDHEGGFYTDPFYLRIEVPENTTVYYTTDSSDPDAHSLRYNNEPIYIYNKSNEDNKYRSIKNVTAQYSITNTGKDTPVDKCFVLKAIAIDGYGNKSGIVTSSFFVNLDKYKNQNVLSITTDPDNLFNDQTGIYVTGLEYDNWYKDLQEEEKKLVRYDGLILDDEGKIVKQSPPINFNLKGVASEREANFELFNSGRTYLNQPIGIRIQGASSRGRELKRFSLYSRKKYSGSKWFDKKIFEDIDSHSLVLREGLNNALAHYTFKNRDVGTQNAIPVAVFLDGEYWYTTYMFEKYSEANISKSNNVTDDNVAVAKNGVQVSSAVKQLNPIEKIQAYVLTEDFSNDEVYQTFNEMVDIQSYIDLTCINVYLANMDTSETKNVEMWHTGAKENNEFGDTRWRWALYDMDLLAPATIADMENPVSRECQINAFTTKGKYVGNAINEQKMYVALKNNPRFSKDFVNTMMDLINSDLSIEIMTKNLAYFNETISYRDYFFRDRAYYVYEHMEEEFNLKGNRETVNVKTNNNDAGTISLNTLNLNLSDTWSGKYYTDYSIKLSVDVNKGYTFLHWEKDGKFYSSDISIDVYLKEGGTTINAIFEEKD